jgi:hypothetical protein
MVEEPLLDLSNDRRVSGSRAHLGDARTHESAAEYAYGFYSHD